MSAPLSWRAESARQFARRRTRWVFGILIALPLILVVAFALDRNPDPTPRAPRLVDLATSGAANFTIFALLVSAELLLFVVAALFAGDPVPAEASWSSLRYLLTAPVRRARLLTSKLVVGFAYVALALVILPLWTLLVGALSYGVDPLTLPVTGGELAWGTFLGRLAIALAYIFVAILPVGAISFWIGVRTDTPLAAVGGALVVLIVSGILDSIDALGHWRNALPGHYSRAWLDLLNTDVDWTAMRHGAAWSLLYAALFLALGYRRFRRQDIVS